MILTKGEILKTVRLEILKAVSRDKTPDTIAPLRKKVGLKCIRKTVLPCDCCAVA